MTELLNFVLARKLLRTALVVSFPKSVAVCTLFLLACSSNGRGPSEPALGDGGQSDASPFVSDAEVPDAQSVDGRANDAGTVDAWMDGGPTDGSQADAGEPVDPAEALETFADGDCDVENSLYTFAALAIASDADAVTLTTAPLGLDNRVVEALLEARRGEDGVLGSGDDLRFQTPAELDAVKWVGCDVWTKLRSVAEQGYLATYPVDGKVEHMVPLSFFATATRASGSCSGQQTTTNLCTDTYQSGYRGSMNLTFDVGINSTSYPFGFLGISAQGDAIPGVPLFAQGVELYVQQISLSHSITNGHSHPEVAVSGNSGLVVTLAMNGFSPGTTLGIEVPYYSSRTGSGRIGLVGDTTTTAGVRFESVVNTSSSAMAGSCRVDSSAKYTCSLTLR